MVGSALFAVGSFPVYAQGVDAAVVGITFFAGSLFFTSAAYSQFLQVVNDAVRPVDRSISWRTNRDGWRGGPPWSNSPGHLLFNLNTFDAMIDGLTATQEDRLVWAPDFLGSIAFLVASHLAWLDVCGRVRCVRTDDPNWWSSAANYIGSIFFMLSAIAAFTLKTTGEVLDTAIVNSATLVGALCFLAGAYIVLPARDSPSG